MFMQNGEGLDFLVLGLLQQTPVHAEWGAPLCAGLPGSALPAVRVVPHASSLAGKDPGVHWLRDLAQVTSSPFLGSAFPISKVGVEGWGFLTEISRIVSGTNISRCSPTCRS